jgi:tRNA nucleotidyltransferase/poly(A) polymerase
MEPEKIIRLVARLNRSGSPVYLTGGAVRDRFLKREPHDLDFTAAGNLRPLAAATADALEAGLFALDEERGTYRVVLEGGRTTLDFSSFRGADLQDDLMGRDFTVNAMAVNLAAPDRLIDPLGGMKDLGAKILRACSSLSMSDDPARTLRAVRLAVGLQFMIEPATLDLIKTAAPLIERISPERVRDEVFRMLESSGASRCLQLLAPYGLEARVLPELAVLRGVTQSAPHIHPVWEHTLATLEAFEWLWATLIEDQTVGEEHSPYSAILIEGVGHYREKLRAHFDQRIIGGRSLRGLLAFALLYHDCAKPSSRSIDPDGRIRFFGHDDTGARIAADRARGLAFSGDEVGRIEKIVAEHMRIHQFVSSGEVKPRSIYRYFRDTAPAGIDICLVSLADTLGTYGNTLPVEHWWAEVDVCRALMEARWERGDIVVSPPRLLNGNQVMRELNLRPGPAVGRLLEALREAQAGGEVAGVEDALEFVRRAAQDLV